MLDFQQHTEEHLKMHMNPPEQPSNVKVQIFSCHIQCALSLTAQNTSAINMGHNTTKINRTQACPRVL